MALQNIEAPTHVVTDAHLHAQTRVESARTQAFFEELRKGRNSLKYTFNTIFNPRQNQGPEVNRLADVADSATVRLVELEARRSAKDYTEAHGPFMPLADRNQAFRQRLSTRVAQGVIDAQDRVMERAVEDNERLGLVGRVYRNLNAFPEGSIYIGILAALPAMLNPDGANPIVVEASRIIGTFFALYGGATGAKEILVNFHSRHDRRLNVGIANLTRRLWSWHEQRVANANNEGIYDAEHNVRGAITEDIGNALESETEASNVILPIVIGVPDGVAAITQSIRNVTARVNPYREWAAEVVSQRRQRSLVLLTALGLTAIMGVNDFLHRPQPILPPRPVPIPTMTPRPTETSTPTKTATPRPIDSPTATGTPTPVVVLEYFPNPDKHYAPFDQSISELEGYAWSKIANVDFNWKNIYGHEFDASPEDMKNLEELRKVNRAYWEHRMKVYAQAIRGLNNGRGVIFGNSIDHHGGNDNIPALLTYSDDEFRKLK